VNETSWAGTCYRRVSTPSNTEHGEIMRIHNRIVGTLSFIFAACQGRSAETRLDTAQVQQPAGSTVTASRDSAPKAVDRPAARPVDTTNASATGKEPGTIPATPTPTVTSESSIAAMRLQLQRLDTASAQTLQVRMTEHGKMLGDLLTTMRVEVQAATSSTKNTWLAAADSVEKNLGQLALAQGEQLRTAFRAHRTRVLRLLEEFRALVPPKST
jgi:hypothetical protein